MAWTPPPEYDELEPSPADDPTRCDACGDKLTADDAGRFRHRRCSAPTLPAEALAVIERLRGARHEH